MRHDRPLVDYFLGPRGSSTAAQKWFSGWHNHVAEKISPAFIHARARYLPNRSSLGLAVNSYIQGLEISLKRRKDGVLHIPTQMLAGFATGGIVRCGPVIVTCHDVIAYLPDVYELAAVRYPKALVARQLDTLRRADAILADSEHCRRAIVERLGIAPERVHLVYLGVDARHYRPRDPNPEIMSRYGLTTGFVNLLYVGTEAPRKNLEGIARAMALLRDRNVPVRLIKVGQVRPSITGFRSLIKELDLDDAIVWHEHVPEEVLPELYSAADVFVFPSLYEGFGLPVLEAMASGCPVVTSTVTSLPEIAGSAALLVDPHSPEAIAGAIQQIVTDAGLRQELVRHGLERASQFSWRRTAEQTLRIYRRFTGDDADDPMSLELPR